MALELVSARFLEADPPPPKWRRLGWDVPDPALLAEATRLQQLIAIHLAQGKNSQILSSGKKVGLARPAHSTGEQPGFVSPAQARGSVEGAR